MNEEKDPLDEFRRKYSAYVDFKQPHQVWIGVAQAYMMEGWGTGISTYVRDLQNMLYIAPNSDAPIPLEGFSSSDYVEIYRRGKNVVSDDYKWDCGFEVSLGGLVIPESSLEERL